VEGLVTRGAGFAATLEAAYRDRRVLVTGHTGFKGAWLCLWLRLLGARVAGLSLDPPSTPNLYEAVDLAGALGRGGADGGAAPDMRADMRGDMRGDIRALADVERALEAHRPEIVFHLAAQPLVRRSYADPLLTLETNVMGTANVLHAAGRCPDVRAVVNITSDKCYENREWVWGYRENEPMGGHDPYSASKGCAELVAAAFQRSFFGPAGRPLLASVRAGNVIGGGDWGQDRLVPDCVRALAAGATIRLRNPGAVRPWQHVLEPLSGYLLLGARLLAGEAALCGGWNFGPSGSEVWPVQRLVESLCRLWGSGDYEIDGAPQPHEAHWLKLDCGKALSLLDWSAILDVETALERTATWYRAFYDAAPPETLRRLTEEQILHYSAQRG
jgi:CDP-glucose 4,6-dehydratase